MKPLRILVVEDNPPDAAMIRAMLDPKEFDVLVAPRIDEAIAQCEKALVAAGIRPAPSTRALLNQLRR